MWAASSKGDRTRYAPMCSATREKAEPMIMMMVSRRPAPSRKRVRSALFVARLTSPLTGRSCVPAISDEPGRRMTSLKPARPVGGSSEAYGGSVFKIESQGEQVVRIQIRVIEGVSGSRPPTTEQLAVALPDCIGDPPMHPRLLVIRGGIRRVDDPVSLLQGPHAVVRIGERDAVPFFEATKITEHL